jgi:hypothetical protein
MIEVIDCHVLVSHFNATGVQAIALVGSYARGDAGPWSDVDLLRLVEDEAKNPPGSGSHLIDGRLVNVSNVTKADVERCFEQPDEAVVYVPGLRAARLLLDRDGAFAAVQARARSFVWDAEMQRRADVWASRQMVGWIEEAYKGLEGLRRDDIGRLLSAQFGLSWGLSRVVQTQRGIMLTSGDNSFWHEIEADLGADSAWVRRRRRAFGVEEVAQTPPTLREQIVAGLHLYCLTADLIAPAIQPADAPLVWHAVEQIKRALLNLPTAA